MMSQKSILINFRNYLPPVMKFRVMICKLPSYTSLFDSPSFTYCLYKFTNITFNTAIIVDKILICSIYEFITALLFLSLSSLKYFVTLFETPLRSI